MAPVAATVVGLAAALDLTLGEWPERVHPVALFGRVIHPVDRPWRAPRVVGVLVATALPLGAALVLGGAVALAFAVHPVLGATLGALVVFSTISLRMLVSVARDVVTLADTDIERARADVRALVGRDATALSPGELRSAALESVAENLADGLVAPLFAFVLGAQVGLGVAVGAAVWVKAVNTLDSMLGYPTKPVGWASARLDDAVMWGPARVAAVAIALAARDVSALWRARRWASTPESPNSGWPMATLAAVLDVELRKPDAYRLNPDAGLPTASDAHHGIRIGGMAGGLVVLAAAVIGWF